MLQVQQTSVVTPPDLLPERIIALLQRLSLAADRQPEQTISEQEVREAIRSRMQKLFYRLGWTAGGDGT